MLEARSLTKYYAHTPAVENVSFTVRPGEILGYLGPNGAGKSTTVKMLTGLIEPSAGQIFFNGRSVWEDLPGFQRRLGYVPEEAHVYPHLSGYEYLQLHGRLRGMPREVLDPKIDEFFRLFSLWDDRHSPLGSYSKGMRQKVLLSAALVHDPEVIILDEPFSGLDVTSSVMLRSLLHELARRGKIILYSSHVLETVEKVCSNVLILRQGQVVAYDSIERLRELMSQPSLEGVFTQLAHVDDGEAVAMRIADTMSSEGPPAPPPGPPPPSPARYFSDLWQDIRYAVRTLRQSPGFTAVAMLSLALGITIVTCAFSEMNGMALRKLPGAERPEELAALQLPVSFPAYRNYREHTGVFASTFAYVAAVPFAVERSERAWGQLVTASYFSTLGVRPLLGCFFSPDEDQPGAVTPAVISYRYWQSHFASDRAVVGRTMRLNSQPVTIAGVGPREFLGASPLLFAADIWVPVARAQGLAPEVDAQTLERRDRAGFRMGGRLRPGVSMLRAEAELDAAAQQFEQEYGDRNRALKGRRVSLVEGGKLLPVRKQDLPFFTSFFIVISALVLLIAFANVANMMLARAAIRRREIAVRLAMGASRARLVRQLLTESMLLVVGAALPAYLASVWLMRQLSTVRMPVLIPVAFDFQPDAAVLLLTTALTAVTGVLFGLAPALQATRTDVASALKESGQMRISRYRIFNLRRLLMISQFAGSLTLLAIVATLSLGVQTTLGVQGGFNPSNLYLISLDPVRDGRSATQAAAFFDKLADRVKLLPSVSSVCLTESVPVSLSGGHMKVAAANNVLTASTHTVGRDYFETAGVPILSGHAFRKDDEVNATAAAIVSREFALQAFGGSDAVGRKIETGDDQMEAATMLPGSYDYRLEPKRTRHRVLEIIGVAGDVAEGLVVQKPRPALYLPLHHSAYAQPPAQGLTLLVRAVPGADAISAVRREISALDDTVTPFQIRTMPQQVDEFMMPLRMASWTYACVGGFGLILAAVGLAGMTAYSVARRWRETGIRIALGASRGNVLALAMREGVVLVAAGTAIGLACSWTGLRLLSAMNASVGRVTSTNTSDPTVVFGPPLLLAALALIACYVPARRSTRVDPAVALRQE